MYPQGDYCIQLSRCWRKLEEELVEEAALPAAVGEVVVVVVVVLEPEVFGQHT